MVCDTLAGIDGGLAEAATMTLMPTPLHRIMALSAAVLISLTAWAQQPQLLSRDSRAAQQNDRRITLDVQVQDAAGNAVHGLAEKDFTVLDNAEAARILSFRSSDETDEVGDVVLMIDAIGCTFEQLARSREQILDYLRQHDGVLAHPTSIVWLVKLLPKSEIAAGRKGATVRALENNDAYLQRLPMSRDGRALAAQLEKSRISVSGSLAAQGAQGEAARTNLSLRALNMVASGEMDIPGRKLVVWIGPSWPPAAPLGDKRTRDNFFNYVVYTYSQLRQSRITLDAVNPGGVVANEMKQDGAMVPEMDASMQQLLEYMQSGKPLTAAQASSFSPLRRPLRAPAQITPADLSLRSLATRTGGRVLDLSNNLAAQLADAATDVDSFYSITYQSSVAKKPDEYHSTEVLVDKPGLTLRTRTGYFAQPR
jgi:VWFA-related protein